MRRMPDKLDIGITRMAGMPDRTVDRYRPRQIVQLIDEFITMFPQQYALFFCSLASAHECRSAHSNTKRRWQCSGAKAVLLAAAIEKRLDLALQVA